MVTLIVAISTLVILYSVGYLRGDPHLIRFILLMVAFTYAMLFMVINRNLLRLFIGWEGVRLCSYLLINFW